MRGPDRRRSGPHRATILQRLIIEIERNPTGSGFECRFTSSTAEYGRGNSELTFKLYADRQTAHLRLVRGSEIPRCLSHPMDPRTVPLYVSREDRELVTNARCIAEVDDKV